MAARPLYLGTDVLQRARDAEFSQRAERDIWKLGFDQQAESDISGLSKLIEPPKLELQAAPEQEPLPIVVSDRPDALALQQQAQARQAQQQPMPTENMAAPQPAAGQPAAMPTGEPQGASAEVAAKPRPMSAPTAGGNYGEIDNSSRQAFVRTAWPYMLQAAGGNQDAAEMMLAAAISENGDVGKGGGFIGNNFFGIKGQGTAGSFNAATWEQEGGQRVNQNADFAAYNNPVEGFGAFFDFLRNNSRYHGALARYEQTGDASQLFQDVNAAGYATDPNWASTVRSIRDTQVAPIVRGASGEMQRVSLTAAPASPPAQGAAAPEAAGVPPAPAASPPSPWANEQATGGLMMKAEDEQLGPKPRPDRNIEPLGPARVGAPMDQRYYESGLGTNRNIPVWGGFIQEGTEPPAPWRNVPVQGAYPDEQYVDENGAYTVPMMQKSDGTEDFLPGDGGVAPQTYEQPFNPDDGPREATPGSVGAQPLPQPAYADQTVSDPAYTQDPTAAPVVDPLDPSTFGPSALPASSAGPRFMQPQPAYRDPREGQGIIARGIDAIGQYLPSTPIVETKPGDAQMFMGEQPASIGTPWDKNDGLWQWRGRLAEGTADALARGLGQDPDQLLLNVTVGGVPIQMSVSELLENVTDPLLGAGFGVGDMVLDAAGKAVMRLVAPYAKGAARETIGRLLNAEPVQNAARAGMEAVREGADTLGRGLQGVGREVAGGLRSVAEEAAYQATFGPRSMARNIVPPGVADRMTGVSVRVVDDPAIVRAIEAAGGSVDRNRGVSVPLVRAQEAEAAGRPVFRGVVYYEPAPPGATKSSYLGELGSGGDQFGGNQTIGAAPSRFRNPIITTHGGDPHADLARQIGIDLDAVYAQLQQPALDAVSGRGDKALLDAVARLGGDATALTDGLSRYADDADMLLQAATENVIWTRARKSGHDGLMIFEPYRDGSERLALTEVGDFREAANPTPARRGGYTLRDEYPLASRAPRLPNDPITAPALNDTPPPLPSDVATRIDAVLGELNEYGMPTGELNWAMQSWHVYPEGSAMREKALALLERATGSSDPAEASALVKSRLAEREAKNPVMLGPSTGPRNAALGTQLATDAGNALAGSMVGAVAPADTPEERLRNTALGAAGFPIAGRLMRRAGGALGTPGIGPNGRPSKPTVEVLQQELDGMRALIQRARAEGNTDLERRAIDRAWQLESALVDARNARLDLEPRITSDVGRRMDELPLTEESASDFAGIGRERVSPSAAADLTEPSAVATDMSGRMNSALPGFDPASAAAGGAAGAMSEGEDGEQGDPLRTAGGMAVAGILGNISPRAAQRWRQATTRANMQAAAARAAGKAPPATAADWLRSIGYSGMIGPSTGIVNAVGNGMELVYHLPKDMARSLARGAPREAWEEAKGLLTGLTRAGGEMLDALAGAHPGGGVENARLSQRVQNPIGQVLANLIEAPTRVFSEVPDAFYRSIATSMGESRRAAQIATDEGLRGAQWSQRVNQLLADVAAHRNGGASSPEVVSIIKDGVQLSERLTLRGDVGPRGEAVKKAFDALPFGVGNLLMPFFNTPYQMLQRGLERSPAGLRMGTQPARFDKYYDAILGSGIGLGVVGLATGGLVSGSGPDDAEKKAMLRSQGWQANSTLVGGVWVPNNAFGVFGPMLDIAGEIGDGMRYQKADNPNLGEDLAKRMLRVVKNQVYLRGLSDLIKATEDPGSFGASYAANVAGRLIPGGATARTVGNMTDPYERQVDSSKDVGYPEAIRQRVARGLPNSGLPVDGVPLPIIGGREDLPPAQDVLGRPQENERSGAAAFGPKTRTPKPDATVQAFTDAGVDIGFPPDKITIDGIPLELTPAEQRRWQRERGAILEKYAGTMTQKPWWDKPAAREAAMKDILREANQAAGAKVQQFIGAEALRTRLRAAALKKKAS